MRILKNLLTEYSQKDKRIISVINEQNKGLPDTLNRGIDIATGSFIARMDGDDISAHDRLEKQLNYLYLHPEIDLLGTDAFVINEEGELIGEYHKLSTDFLKNDVALYHNQFNSSTWFGKCELFKKCRYRNLPLRGLRFHDKSYALGYHFTI